MLSVWFCIFLLADRKPPVRPKPTKREGKLLVYIDKHFPKCEAKDTEGIFKLTGRK